mmetsp:Transcript_14208/g.35957  ORF Transcript_14208/g.35957 Transcript_14208/m.35957 type:complete len:200 (+) Transcript_14208:3-602(+)
MGRLSYQGAERSRRVQFSIHEWITITRILQPFTSQLLLPRCNTLSALRTTKGSSINQLADWMASGDSLEMNFSITCLPTSLPKRCPTSRPFIWNGHITNTDRAKNIICPASSSAARKPLQRKSGNLKNERKKSSMLRTSRSAKSSMPKVWKAACFLLRAVQRVSQAFFDETSFHPFCSSKMSTILFANAGAALRLREME